MNPDDMTEFLRAEGLRNRGLDELDLPTDIVELLGEFGFETVDDVFDADPIHMPAEAVDALTAAFGAEGVAWGSATNAMEESHEAAIEEAVGVLLDTYRSFHVAEAWPEVGWRLFRSKQDLELHLTDGTVVRGRLSAPLLLAASYRAAAIGAELTDEFGRVISFPREPLLEEQIGPELLRAAHAFLADDLDEEATLLARRALREGALGFLSKRSAPETLIEALTTVAAAKRYIDAGDLVPDSVTNRMVRERLAGSQLVDGRTGHFSGELGEPTVNRNEDHVSVLQPHIAAVDSLEQIVVQIE